MDQKTKTDLIGELSQLISLSEFVGRAEAIGDKAAAERWKADRKVVADRIKALLED